MKNVVVVAGIETIRDSSGCVLKLSETFMNNARTYKKDHKSDNVVIINAADHKDARDPVNSLWLAILGAFGEKGKIDELFYTGHSDSTTLYVFSHVRMELDNYMRLLTADNPWQDFPYSKDAVIRLGGCQAGGQRGEKWVSSIAQVISNKTGKKVFAFVMRSSQKIKNGGYYQISDGKKGYVEFTPI